MDHCVVYLIFNPERSFQFTRCIELNFQSFSFHSQTTHFNQAIAVKKTHSSSFKRITISYNLSKNHTDFLWSRSALTSLDTLVLFSNQLLYCFFQSQPLLISLKWNCFMAKFGLKFMTCTSLRIDWKTCSKMSNFKACPIIKTHTLVPSEGKVIRLNLSQN